LLPLHGAAGSPVAEVATAAVRDIAWDEHAEDYELWLRQPPQNTPGHPGANVVK
jgi:hypothetical protein